MPAAAPTAAAPLISGGSPTIFVTEMDRAVRFYTQTLGLGLIHRAGDHFALVDARGGLRIGLHPAGPKSPAPGTSGATQLGLNVAQPIEAVVKTLAARGVDFVGTGPGIVFDDGAVKLAFFRDPDGNIIYLCEVKP